MNIEMTEDRFREEVFKKTKGGIPFIIAVYETYEEFRQEEITKGNIQLACKAGCSVCCHQLVTCTEQEMETVVGYIEKTYAKRYIEILKERRKNTFRKWERYYAEKIMKDPSQYSDPQKVHKDWLGYAPCVFLNKKGSCDIYAVRPISCRILSSLKKCQNIKDNESKILRFKSDLWANQMLTKPFVPVVPLVHWILVKYP